jgi:hypothetical protein
MTRGTWGWRDEGGVVNGRTGGKLPIQGKDETLCDRDCGLADV